jgi:biotin synthase
MKISYATAVKLGIKKGKLDFEMPTGYIMLGEKCVYNCQFCAQARNSSTSLNMLSRVTWKELSLTEFKNIFDENLFKRICLQVVSSINYEEELYELLSFFKEKDIKISVSIRPKNIEEVKKLFDDYEIDNLGIAIDVADENLFKKIKGTHFDNFFSILCKSAELYVNKITTHLIVGLGECDADLISLMEKLKKINVTVGLFAFTPIKGTLMGSYEKPSLERYRKIQYSREIIYSKEKYDNTDFKFDENGNLIELPKIELNRKEAEKTSGCEFCTRPYYNEKPKKDNYNVPTIRKS